MEEKENSVTITKEDVKNTRDFFKHFSINLPKYLDSALSSIEAVDEITVEHQANLKTMIARALVENRDHELLKDELFEEVLPNCQKEWFDKQFEQDFENFEEKDDK